MTIDFEGIQKKINYYFKNADLLQQAFIRRSYSEEMGGQNNEILEFIGDKALDLAVIRIMMERFGEIDNSEGYSEFEIIEPQYFSSNLKEGQFTDLKKELVQKKALARSMEELGFYKQMYMGYGDTEAHINEQDSVKEDLFEAIVGAVTLDSKWNMNVITNVVTKMIDFEAFFEEQSAGINNYVGWVQTWAQQNTGKLPKYKYGACVDGYNCILEIDGIESNCGTGTSKSKARMDAAKNMYEFMVTHRFIRNKYEEAVGRPIENEALRQMNELVQKGLVDKPKYTFTQSYNEKGEALWTCECSIKDHRDAFVNTSSSKKEAQRLSTYEMLLDLFEVYDEEYNRYIRNRRMHDYIGPVDYDEYAQLDGFPDDNLFANLAERVERRMGD